jgi:hypothetical protein
MVLDVQWLVAVLVRWVHRQEGAWPQHWPLALAPGPCHTQTLLTAD